MAMRPTGIQAAAILLALTMTICAAAQTKTPQKAAGSAPHPIVLMETSMGAIKIEVLTDKAPITAKNFLNYVNMGFFNGTIFHRVVPAFVIQGGGYLENMSPRPTMAPIKNESKNGLKNLRGTLSMARYDNPDSATSQFFINLKDNANLDPEASTGGWGYAVFAKVVDGMDVVDKIAAVKTGTRNVQGTPFADVPLQPVVVKTVKVIS
jgi:peptidyl-prolyl cis-trans isomerase A (cyclophilin A)